MEEKIQPWTNKKSVQPLRTFAQFYLAKGNALVREETLLSVGLSVVERKILNLLKSSFLIPLQYQSGKCESQVFCMILGTIIIPSKMGSGG